jgi:hypothetical protein
MLGKTLLFSAKVKSIKSNRTDPESKSSVLRIWRDSPNPNDTLLGTHSLMYYYNTAKKLERQRPIEISCLHTFLSLVSKQLTNFNSNGFRVATSKRI